MKKVCVVTSTRADYGLLFWTMKELEASSSLELQLVVTGMHLSSKFGETYENILADGFRINEKIDLGELKDSNQSVAEQMAIGIKEFSKTLLKLQPDLVLILGDRYEIWAVAQASLLNGVPLAHIHGGEVTEGAFDDAIRHSITKMSSLHFTASSIYRRRVIQLGEAPQSVFNVGAPGLENFLKLKLLSKKEVGEALNFELKNKNILVTYHPVTIADEDGTDALLQALAELPEVGQIITLPNSDPGHEAIFQKIINYAANRGNVHVSTSLGQLNYLSLMKVCDSVVGNSSSGIIEAPFCGVPTVNIGVRQRGRLLAKTVTQVDELSKYEILEKIKLSIEQKCSSQNIFGDGRVSKNIVRKIEMNINNLSQSKKFFDVSTGITDEE